MKQGVKAAMFPGEKETQTVKVVDTLEAYRRLIGLQKQMIELSQQHEKTKRECAALRVQLLEEMTRLRHPQRHSVRGTVWSETSWLKGLKTIWNSHLQSCPKPESSLLPGNRLLKV